MTRLLERTARRAAAFALGGLLLGASAFTVSACGSAPPPHPIFGEGWALEVLGAGHRENAELCADFRLGDDQAREFFRRAVPITQRELHDRHDLLGCWVEGRVESAGREFRFEIDAGGTAKVTGPAGEVRRFACEGCDDLFGG